MTVLDRAPAPQMPIEVSKRDRAVKIQIVDSLDDRQKVMALRAAVFLGKPGWTYEHTFDANDHCAIHILGTVDNEPAGTVRVRFFQGFARIERIAILPSFSSIHRVALLNGLARAATRLCASKGYDKVGGLAYPELVKFWSRHGGQPCGEALPSEYGTVIPILLTPKETETGDLAGPDIGKAGSAAFEWDIFKWEGTGVCG